MENRRDSANPAVDEPSDTDLLERFIRRQDEAAFAELVRRYGAMVLGVCRRVLDNAADSEDAFQATFLVLVRRADAIRKRDSLASWLYGVALRVARRARSSQARRRDRERRAAVPEAVTSPEAVWSDLRPVLDDAVEALPEKYRVLVVLCYLQGRTYEEAARLLDLAKGTVATRLTRARALLRRRLRQRGLAFPVALLAVLLERYAAPAGVPPHLPPRAAEAGRGAAGRGGPVPGRVVSLADAVSHRGRALRPWAAAAVALALVAIASGLLLWRGRVATPDQTGRGEPSQVWQARRTIADQPTLAVGLVFSPHQKTLAWHAGDGSVRLAEVATGRQTVLAPAGAAFRMPLGFTPDSRRLVTHALEGPVVVWGVPTGQEVARYPGSWATALAPDGTALATVRPDAVHLIDLADGRDRSVAGLGPGPVQCLAFSPDSATLAVGGGGGTILLYDRATLRQRGSLQGNAGPTLELAFSPDGTALAARYDQRGRAAPEAACEVRLWQLATGQSRLVAAPGTFALGFAPGGRTLATQELDGAVDLWDVASGARRLGLGRSPGAARLYRVVFSPDGKAIVTPAPGGVQLRDTATGRVLATLRGHSGAVGDAAFSGDGRTLATGTGGVPVGDAPARPAEIRLWERVE